MARCMSQMRSMILKSLCEMAITLLEHLEKLRMFKLYANSQRWAQELPMVTPEEKPCIPCPHYVDVVSPLKIRI